MKNFKEQDYRTEFYIQLIFTDCESRNNSAGTIVQIAKMSEIFLHLKCALAIVERCVKLMFESNFMHIYASLKTP